MSEIAELLRQQIKGTLAFGGTLQDEGKILAQQFANNWAIMEAQLAILERLEAIEGKIGLVVYRGEREYRGSKAETAIHAPQL